MTRYYVPEWCRWLSSDNVGYLDPKNISGLNLFAYCGNNPVTRIDPTGTSWKDVWGWIQTIGGILKMPAKVVSAELAIITAIIDGRWSDVAHDWKNGSFNSFNQSEQVALDSKVFSFYKGSVVVRQNLVNGFFSSFGTTFLNSNTYYTSDDLNHEWGHLIQERMLGIFYYSNIAIPSVPNYHFGSGPYYSKPWERSADFLGGVNRGNYQNGSLAWGLAYLALGPIVAIPYYLFN